MGMDTMILAVGATIGAVAEQKVEQAAGGRFPAAKDKGEDEALDARQQHRLAAEVDGPAVAGGTHPAIGTAVVAGNADAVRDHRQSSLHISQTRAAP